MRPLPTWAFVVGQRVSSPSAPSACSSLPSSTPPCWWLGDGNGLRKGPGRAGRRDWSSPLPMCSLPLVWDWNRVRNACSRACTTCGGYSGPHYLVKVCWQHSTSSVMLAGELVELKAVCNKMWHGTSTSGMASIPVKQGTILVILRLGGVSYWSKVG